MAIAHMTLGPGEVKSKIILLHKAEHNTPSNYITMEEEGRGEKRKKSRGR
jgi:hypothetical protein